MEDHKILRYYFYLIYDSPKFTQIETMSSVSTAEIDPGPLQTAPMESPNIPNDVVGERIFERSEANSTVKNQDDLEVAR